MIQLVNKTIPRPSRSILIWLFVVSIGLIAALPLWQDGFLNKRIIGETPYLLMRVQQLYSALRDGVFPVRWMPDAAYGLGYPFFNYYAALPYYFAAILRLLGIGTVFSIKLIQTLSFIIGALAVFGWSRRHFRYELAAIVAAALFTFAPMHLINIYTRGDSLSEFWAMSMYPCLLWAIDRVIEHPRPKTTALLALATAALMLSHNISALIFMPIAAFYGLWMLPNWTDKRIWLALTGAGILGLALSAWFWVPALLDQPSLRMENMLVGFFDYHNSFLDQTPFQTTWLIDYETYPYRPGLWQTLTTLIGAISLILSLFRTYKNRDRRFALWILIAFILSVTMTFSISTWAYEHLSLLKYLQFPWRWLSVVSLFGAVVGAYLTELVHHQRLCKILVVTIVLITFVTALASLNLSFIPLSEDQITAQRLNEAEFYSGDIGTTVRTDYLPASAYPRPLSGPSILGLNPLKVLSGEGKGELVERHANWQSWRIQVTSNQAVISVPILYWPGWTAYLENGTRLSTFAVDGIGWIQTTVTHGEHIITFRLDETPQRWFFNVISMLALLLWLAIILHPLILGLCNRSYLRQFVPVVVAILIVLFAFSRISAVIPVNGPQASQFLTVSYRHSFPNGISFNGAGRLLDYQYPNEVEAGKQFEIALKWDKPIVAYIEIIPAPNNFWGYKAALASTNGSDHIRFNIPNQAAPGLYFVHVTAGKDSYDLKTIRIKANSEKAPALDQATNFGDTLRLNSVTLDAIDHGRLNVYFNWQVLKPITRNYGLSVRLRNHSGVEIAKHDAALGVYGTVPPAYWGEYFNDWISLTDLDGLPPGEGYQLIVTVFDNDRAIGSADLRNIAIQHSPTQAESIFTTNFSGEVKSVNDPIEQGASLNLDCVWQGKVQPNWKVRWWLQSSDSNVQLSTPLAPGARPDWWQPNQRYHAIVPLQIPIELTIGTYSLRWDIVDATNNVAVSGQSIGTINITPTSRLFTRPSMPNVADAQFGELIRLTGYDLIEINGTLNLQLAWQAITKIDTNYTYFVHVQRIDAPTPAAQIDTMPHENQYPTTQWLPNEYVKDKTSVSLAGLPSGTYDVWLGWYNSQNGTRLAVSGAEDGRYRLTTISIP